MQRLLVALAVAQSSRSFTVQIRYNIEIASHSTFPAFSSREYNIFSKVALMLGSCCENPDKIGKSEKITLTEVKFCSNAIQGQQKLLVEIWVHAQYLFLYEQNVSFMVIWCARFFYLTRVGQHKRLNHLIHKIRQGKWPHKGVTLNERLC